MRRTIATILILCISLTCTDAHELLRCPVVVLHYLHHTQTNPSLELSEFLYDHYSSKTDNDSDSRDDSRLPFKDSSSFVSDQMPVVELLNSKMKFQPLYVHLNSPAHPVPDVPEAPGRDVFEPPRR